MMALKVLRKELKENFKKPRMTLMVIIFLITSLTPALAMIFALDLSAFTRMDLIIPFIIYFYPILTTLILFSMISQDVIFIEKMKKGYESVLATPLSVSDLVLGKSFFFVLFTYPLVIVVMLVLLILLYLLNLPISLAQTLLYLVLMLPLLQFSLSIIITALVLQFRGAQFIIQVVMFIVVFGTSFLSFALPFASLSNMSILSFIAVLLFILVVLAAVCVFLMRTVDIEKIILTS